MRAPQLILALPLCLAFVACEGEPQASSGTDSGAGAGAPEITLPSESEADAMEAAANQAAGEITAENADAALDQLESQIGGDDGQ
jgi:hypothetical protein